MILGLSVPVFTEFHVLLSLIGIASGLVVAFAMVRGKRVPRLTALFLASTVATSATGFLFPTAQFDPAKVVGVISLVALTVAIAALYSFKLTGAWRWIYVASAIAALYLNSFVGVVQTFQKVAAFHALAPTQTEPPFKIAQGLVLIGFIVLGVLAVRRFRPSLRTAAYAS